MKNLGYYNGIYDLIENMTVPMSDRVCWFGDGVYDATATRNIFKSSQLLLPTVGGRPAKPGHVRGKQVGKYFLLGIL